MVVRKVSETPAHKRLAPSPVDMCFADGLADMVARFDRELRHLYVNHAVAAVTGLPRASFIGKTHRELGLSTEMTRWWEHALEAALHSGRPSEVRLSLRQPTGERAFTVWFAPELDAAGEVKSVVSIARDVTDSVHISAELEALKWEYDALRGDRHLDTEVGIPDTMDSEVATEHFKAIVQYSSDAIISKTLDGVITSWNRGAKDIFGYSAAEMLGRPMEMLLPPDRVNEERFILEKLALGERVHNFETRRLRKDGSLVDVAVTVSPICDREGRIIGASKIARDISERVRMESAARQYEAIVQSTDDAVIGRALDGTVTSWNPGAEAMFGYLREEMLGQSMLMLLPPDRRNEEDLILERIRCGEKVDHFETVRVHKSGRRIHVSATISPIRDRDGWIVGASKIARDITRQKTTEARLLLISNVFTHTGEGVVIADARGRIVDVNDAFTRITGFAREEAIGKTAEMFRTSRQSLESLAELRTALNAFGHCQGEVWSRKSNGDSFASLMTVSAVKGARGQPQNYVAIFADVTELRMQQDQIEHVAHYDVLTDLPNRLLLSDRLNQAMAISARRHQSLAVLYLDLDGFKAINDRYGHAVGDDLLVAIARRMKGVIREIDTLSRVGGDEFVAVLADIQSPKDCQVLVDRILHACAEPVLLQDLVLRVSASIGVTLFPQDAVNADHLIRHADRAMYEAKLDGKNRYHLFDSIQDAEFRSREEHTQRLAAALAAGELVLHCQPRMHLAESRVVGLDAQICWQHPERGLLSAEEFMPLAESGQLGDAVSRWMLHAALAQLAQWEAEGLSLPICVHVPTRQVLNHGFALLLNELLVQYPEVAPRHLELEVSESAVLQDLEAVTRVLRECLQLGVQFSIRDFGAGFSSLGMLNRIPAQTLKLDQSLVRDMLVDAGKMAVVQGLIGLAHALTRNVVAEGVDTPALAARLLELGCEIGLGQALAPVMQAQQIAGWLRERPVQQGSHDVPT